MLLTLAGVHSIVGRRVLQHPAFFVVVVYVFMSLCFRLIISFRVSVILFIGWYQVFIFT